jgi:U4/U6.U5 tri-snRNP-associated protein 3
VAEFVDGIASETKTEFAAPNAVDEDEKLMKKLGIPTGFTTTKGKYVGDANHSAVKLTTKRTPRQYMNRRGGFNRPLPAESNR